MKTADLAPGSLVLAEMTTPKHGPGTFAYRHGCTCLACAIARRITP